MEAYTQKNESLEPLRKDIMAAMKKHGLNISTFSQHCEITRPTLYTLLNGRNVTLTICAKIREGLERLQTTGGDHENH